MILNAPFQPPPILYFKQVYAAVLLPVTCTFAANEDSQGASMLLLGAGPHGHGKMPASQSKERSSINCLTLDVYCSLFKHISTYAVFVSSYQFDSICSFISCNHVSCLPGLQSQLEECSSVWLSPGREVPFSPAGLAKQCPGPPYKRPYNSWTLSVASVSFEFCFAAICSKVYPFKTRRDQCKKHIVKQQLENFLSGLLVVHLQDTLQHVGLSKSKERNLLGTFIHPPSVSKLFILQSKPPRRFPSCFLACGWSWEQAQLLITPTTTHQSFSKPPEWRELQKAVQGLPREEVQPWRNNRTKWNKISKLMTLQFKHA